MDDLKNQEPKSESIEEMRERFRQMNLTEDQKEDARQRLLEALFHGRELED